MRHFMIGALSLVLIAMGAGLVGCETLATPAGAGAATGATTGAIVGSGVEDAAIGGVVGGATGYIIDRANPRTP